MFDLHMGYTYFSKKTILLEMTVVPSLKNWRIVWTIDEKSTILVSSNLMIAILEWDEVETFLMCLYCHDLVFINAACVCTIKGNFRASLMLCITGVFKRCLNKTWPHRLKSIFYPQKSKWPFTSKYKKGEQRGIFQVEFCLAWLKFYMFCLVLWFRTVQSNALMYLMLPLSLIHKT